LFSACVKKEIEAMFSEQREKLKSLKGEYDKLRGYL
jgi:hypothetical protein